MYELPVAPPQSLHAVESLVNRPANAVPFCDVRSPRRRPPLAERQLRRPGGEPRVLGAVEPSDCLRGAKRVNAVAVLAQPFLESSRHCAAPFATSDPPQFLPDCALFRGPGPVSAPPAPDDVFDKGPDEQCLHRVPLAGGLARRARPPNAAPAVRAEVAVTFPGLCAVRMPRVAPVLPCSRGVRSPAHASCSHPARRAESTAGWGADGAHPVHAWPHPGVGTRGSPPRSAPRTRCHARGAGPASPRALQEPPPIPELPRVRLPCRRPVLPRRARRGTEPS